MSEPDTVRRLQARLGRGLLAAGMLALLLGAGCIKVISVPACPAETPALEVTVVVPLVIPETATLPVVTCTPVKTVVCVTATPEQAPRAAAPTATPVLKRTPPARPRATADPPPVATSPVTACPPQPCLTPMPPVSSVPQACPTIDPCLSPVVPCP